MGMVSTKRGKLRILIKSGKNRDRRCPGRKLIWFTSCEAGSCSRGAEVLLDRNPASGPSGISVVVAEWMQAFDLSRRTLGPDLALGQHGADKRG